jgi:FAD dependent oxidoreductase
LIGLLLVLTKPGISILSDASLLSSRRFDVIIVGAGISGLTGAFRLSAGNSKIQVLVIEAGPFGPTAHLDSGAYQPSGFERWCKSSADPFSREYLGRGNSWRNVERRVFGGRGLYWSGLLCRIDPDEFSSDEPSLRWLRESGLSDEGAAYATVEQYLSSAGFLQLGGQSLIGADREMGDLVKFKSMDRAARTEPNQPGVIRIFSPLDFFDLTQNSDNVCAIHSSLVRKLSRQARVWSAHATHRGEEIRFYADRVILACGARSAAEILTETLVGNGDASFFLSDHLVAGAAIRMADYRVGAAMRDDALSKIYAMQIANSKGFNLFLSISKVPGGYVIDCWGMGEKDLTCLTKFEVTKTGQDSIKTRIENTWAQSDLAKMGEMTRYSIGAIRQFLQEAEIRHEIEFDWKTPYETIDAMRLVHHDNSASERTVVYRSTAGTVDHEGCMRSNIFNAGGSGAIRQANGIYLNGPPAFFRMGSANPTLTTMSLAIRQADEILRG